MEKITFIIAENNDLCRFGFIKIIQDQFLSSSIYEVSEKSQLQNLLAENNQAVVIMDAEEFGFTDHEQLSKFSLSYPLSRWIFVASVPDGTFLRYLSSSLQKASFVVKTNDYDVIVTALKNTIAGHNFYCSEGLQVIMDGYCKRKSGVSPGNNLLTPTELELVHLIAQGKTAKEIAQIRCLSPHTVNTHRKNIFRKLQISSVQELIRVALKNHWVDLTEYYI